MPCAMAYKLGGRERRKEVKGSEVESEKEVPARGAQTAKWVS